MAYRIMEPRFPLGKTVATPGAMALGIDLAFNNETPKHRSRPPVVI